MSEKEAWRAFGNTIITDKHCMVVVGCENGEKVAEQIVAAVNKNDLLKVSGTAYQKAAVKFADENRELRKALSSALSAYAQIDELLDNVVDSQPEGMTRKERETQRNSNSARDAAQDVLTNLPNEE